MVSTIALITFCVIVVWLLCGIVGVAVGTYTDGYLTPNEKVGYIVIGPLIVVVVSIYLIFRFPMQRVSIWGVRIGTYLRDKYK